MPVVRINGTSLHYDQQGSGEPLILIPFLTADHACFAFQMPAYAEDFCCYAVDLRGSGASPRGDAPCTIEQFVDDMATFMDAVGIEAAHVVGYSLGAAVAMRLATAFPERMLSVSLHSAWPRTDSYLRTVVESWRVMASALDDVCETTIEAIFPWCFTPELYAARPEFLASLAAFVRGRPKQSVQDFLEHAGAVIAHDALGQLDRIIAPTQITFGAYDVVTSTRFAEPMLRAIPNAELEIFQNCSHAPFYEDIEGFNASTLSFLRRHISPVARIHVPAPVPPA
ncbi:MAG TPA: alpha/beta hydrolase [Sphingomonas sp.]|nr:alpha/beta hydrolase [Sphingomonas sp.]